MYQYAIKYNVYSGTEAPREFQTVESAATQMDESDMKRVLQTKHSAQVTLISWKEITDLVP